MAEVKTGGVKVEAVLSASTKKRFQRICTKRKISMAQSIRDFVQDVVKEDSKKKNC